jgi:hypothetical protein
VIRTVAVLALVVSGVPCPGVTQGSQPLRKTDVIRLLSNPLISRREVADLIRRNCVAFRPTPRDWADLRDFGADSEVLSSIGGCATTSAAQRAAPTPPLAAVLLPARLGVTVGGEAVVRVQVKRGETPQAGVALVLRGSSAIPGGPPRDVQAVTDASGIAVFRLPVGRLPATYSLDVVTGSGASIPGTPPLELVVAPAVPAAAAVQPGRVELRAGERGTISLLVTVRDSLGNTVPGEVVALQPDSPDMGVAADARSSDSIGRAEFAIERAAVRHGGKLTIRVRGQPLGSVDVVRADVMAPAATGFVSGVGQRGIARTRLSEPLVFQVRSTLGRPLVGKVVTFRGVNAEVVTDSVLTDSAGIARVGATFGKQAGPALVTATVDLLQRQAALTVDPAAPASVILERDGNRVDGGTMLATVGVTFALRVSAQDAYGNPAPTADLARMIQTMRNRFNLQSQLLKMVSVESEGGAATATFKPVAPGQADLSIAGATVSVAIAAR